MTITTALHEYLLSRGVTGWKVARDDDVLCIEPLDKGRKFTPQFSEDPDTERLLQLPPISPSDITLKKVLVPPEAMSIAPTCVITFKLDLIKGVKPIAKEPPAVQQTDPEPEQEETEVTEVVEVDVDDLDGAAIDALVLQHEVEVPDDWATFTVAEKRIYLKEKFEDNKDAPAEEVVEAAAPVAPSTDLLPLPPADQDVTLAERVIALPVGERIAFVKLVLNWMLDVGQIDKITVVEKQVKFSRRKVIETFEEL